MEGENRTTALAVIHKYVRSIILDHFGAEPLKEKFLPQIEVFVSKTLEAWSTQSSVEVKHAASIMAFDFSAKSIMLSYDAEKSPMKLSEKLINVAGGFLSFPLNTPGFAYHKFLKDQKEALSMLRKIVKEKMNSLGKHEDMLDQAINNMNKEKVLSEDFLARWVFGISFATFEAISTALSLALKLIADNPAVLQELTAEHKEILKARKNPNSILTWDEYKSVTFTLQVINEVFRIANVSPGLLRKALKDIKFKGYTILAGWTIMLVNSALQLNSNTYKKPLAFNPWRWKDLDPFVVSKNFMPFGGGIRQCAGAEYTKTFTAIFLHVLVTKYRYGPIFRTSLVGCPVVVSIDPEFNHHIAKQEGRLVELWYLDSYSKIFTMEEALEKMLLSQIEELVVKALQTWSSQPSVEVKHAASVLILHFGAKLLIGYDHEKSPRKMSETFNNVAGGFMVFPLNIPGTAHYKSLKDQTEAVNMLRKIIKERINSPENHHGDFLDQAINDIDTEKYLTEDIIIYSLFGLLYTNFDAISSIIAFTLKLLEDQPKVLQELQAEHEAILKGRENPSSTLTWNEYKSMTFTFQVINEVLRIAAVSPGLLRRALKDIEYKGYTIPAGWTIMLANSALQLNPNTYKDPLAFNPWRWKLYKWSNPKVQWVYSLLERPFN
uniref:Cytochrome P450 n=1 Tax=Quercus lobata TaxID=97700 RepID=A0A7N2N0U5_QUELO